MSYLAEKPQTRSTPRLAPFEGWFSLILLGIALYCVVGSIIGAKWISHTDSSTDNWLLLSPAVGLLIGLLVAKMSHFPQFILHVGACLVGYWLSVWLISTVVFQIPWAMVFGDLRATVTGQFGSLAEPHSDAIFFFYLSFLCFFLGYFGSWLVYRAHLPWLVALVYFSILLVNLNFAKQDMSFLTIIMAAALLLLVARMQLVIQIAQWKQEGLYTDRQWLRSMKRSYMQAASIIVAVTLVLSWLLPIQAQDASGKAFWDHLNTAVTDAVNGHLSWQDFNAFLTGGNQGTFFGDQLTISNSIQLPNTEILRYHSSDGNNAGHYMEAYTFNTFDGRTWTASSDQQPRTFGANDLLAPDTLNQTEPQEHIQVSITLPPDGTKNYLFAPTNPHSFSVPTAVYYDGANTGTAWTQQTPLSAQEHYEVMFVPPPVPPATSPRLSSSMEEGLFMPYLEVPPNLGRLVQQDALAWTSGTNNEYDALKQLEQHLSDPTVFHYSLNNPPIPDNTDVISWLLQTRTGYCTYYATAMTIMARMLNIPTRMVNGFSQGRYQNGEWVVNGSDAHSWVQAFFPGYGWVNFDPTPGFSPNALPPQQPPNTLTPTPSPTTGASTPTSTVTPKATSPKLKNIGDDPPSIFAPLGSNTFWWIIVSLAGLLLAVTLLLVAVARYWWLNLYTSSPLISAVYWRFCRLASFFGMAPRSWQTPYEYSHMIGKQFPHRAASFSRLTDLFVQEHWGEPQQVTRGLKEAEVKDLPPSLRSLLTKFFLDKLKRKPAL